MREGHRDKILIIDDSPTTLRSLGEVLHGEYDVLLATSGNRGLDIATTSHPDLILLDIQMPDMNGFDVIRRLKSNPELAKIPVIFLTASTEEDSEVHGLQLGAVDFIVKPYVLPVALARIRTHLALKHRNDILERIAMFDALTAIPNRRSFDEALDEEWRRSVRSGTPFSILLIDIDYFKKFNDHYGHAEGDNCLVRVARALQDSLRRAGDKVFRYGGEEFAAILFDTDETGAVSLGQQMCDKIQALQIPHAASPVAPHVSISIGVASKIPRLEIQPADLFAAADRALYQAKEHGRNRVRTTAFSDPLN